MSNTRTITPEELLELNTKFVNLVNKDFSNLYDFQIQKTIDALDAFIQQGVDPKEAVDEDGNTVLHHVWGLRRCTDAQMLLTNHLLEYGIDIDKRNRRGRTPLMQAVNENAAKVVEAYLAKGAAVDLVDKDQNTALHLSHGMSTESLLRAGADPNSINAKGYTSLMYVAQNGNRDGVHFLLEAGAGATINHISKEGETSLSLTRNPECMKALIAEGANVNLVSEKDGSSPLTKLCAEKTSWRSLNKEKHAECVKVLLEAKAVVDHKDAKGNTALVYAVQNSDGPTVRVLTEYDADIMQAAPGIMGGITEPLEMDNYLRKVAVLTSRSDQETADTLRTIADHLRMENVGAEKVNDLNHTFMELVNKDFSAWTYDQAVQRIKELEDLVKQGAIPGIAVDAEGNNALHLLSASRQWSYASKLIYYFLLAQGVNINGKNNQGYTPLMVASKANNQDAVDAEIKRGAEVNHIAYDKHSALTVNTDLDCMETLLAAGADPNHADADDYTALMRVAEYTVRHEDEKYKIFTAINPFYRRDVDFNHISKKDGNSALTIVRDEISIDRLTAAAEAKVNLDHVNNEGFSALMYALRDNNPFSVSILVERGADVKCAGAFLDQISTECRKELLDSAALREGVLQDLLISAGITECGAMARYLEEAVTVFRDIDASYEGKLLLKTAGDLNAKAAVNAVQESKKDENNFEVSKEAMAGLRQSGFAAVMSNEHKQAVAALTSVKEEDKQLKRQLT